MKKFFSAITLSLACLILVFIGPVYAADPEFHPDENPYEDLFFGEALIDEFSIELEVVELEPVVNWSEIRELLAAIPFEYFYDNGEIVTLVQWDIDLIDFTSNIEIDEAKLSLVTNDPDPGHGMMFQFVSSSSTLEIGWEFTTETAYFNFDGDPSDFPTLFNVTIQLPEPILVPSVLPWTQNYTYGRVRSYDLELNNQPSMTYDSSNER